MRAIPHGNVKGSLKKDQSVQLNNNNDKSRIWLSALGATISYYNPMIPASSSFQATVCLHRS